jgi:predicted SprT family Zn-dependent metalloprotease
MNKFEINERILEVIFLANYLMEKHKVDYLSFDFSNDKAKLGYYTGESIKINYMHALLDPIDEIKDTILHEIAHAIAGSENLHNEYWKAIAKEIGAKTK